jgi:four helix bundle protein
VGRLKKDFVARTDAFADRILDVVHALQRRDCPAFARDQLGRRDTSVGSNASEPDEAISVPECRHRLGIALRELGETKYWLRMTARRQWLKAESLRPLRDEAAQLTRILAAVIIRSGPKARDADLSNIEEERTPSSG